MSAINGVFSQVYLAGARYLCVGAPSFSAPLGTSFLPITGSAEPFLTSKGMIEPVVSMRLLCRDFTATSTNGNPLSDTFLAMVFGRSAIPYYDASGFGGTQPGSLAIGGVAAAITAGSIGCAFTDGASVVALYGCKIASARISGAKGGVVTMDVTVVGTGFYIYDMPTVGVDTVIQSMMPTTGYCSDPLWFPAFNFSEAWLASKVFSFDMSYSNNLDPNRALNGTYFPAAQNAMSPSGTLALTLQPLDGAPGDHTGTTGATATMVISNPAGTRIAGFKMANLKSISPFNRSGTLGRVLRSFQYLLGGDCNSLNTSASRIITPAIGAVYNSGSFEY